jgi:anti-sigma-K factor RskA
MITKGVPQPPDGKVYQLWLQSPAQKMVSAGLMPDSQRPTLLSGDATEAIGAGLSLEPAGGSQEPTDVLATFAFSNKA